jgi:hypothetical protein
MRPPAHPFAGDRSRCRPAVLLIHHPPVLAHLDAGIGTAGPEERTTLGCERALPAPGLTADAGGPLAGPSIVPATVAAQAAGTRAVDRTRGRTR